MIILRLNVIDHQISVVDHQISVVDHQFFFFFIKKINTKNKYKKKNLVIAHANLV